MGTASDILLDDSLWPLLVVRFVGVPTTPQVERYLEKMEGYLGRGERYLSLLDSSRMTGMGPAEQRHLQAAWLKRHDARLRELSLGNAFVITSPLVRLAVSVVIHLKPLTSPYLIVATRDEAQRWALARLEAAGLHSEAQRIRAHLTPPLVETG